MSVDTKGCLVTEMKNPFKIANLVCGKIRAMLEEASGAKGFRVNRAEGFKLPTIRMVEWAEMLHISFEYKGEDRMLTINFDCDCDLEIYDEIEGNSCIWFKLGCWGSSEILMREILGSVKEFGRIYIDVNDSDDIEFQEIL